MHGGRRASTILGGDQLRDTFASSPRYLLAGYIRPENSRSQNSDVNDRCGQSSGRQAVPQKLHFVTLGVQSAHDENGVRRSQRKLSSTLLSVQFSNNIGEIG